MTRSVSAQPKVSKWFGLTALQVGVYNNWDCVSTARLAKHIPALMEKYGDAAYYAREVWPSIPCILDMQRRGVPINTATIDTLRADYETELHITELGIFELAGLDDANLRSPVQRAALLFDRLGFKPVRHTATGRDSTDQEVLDKLYSAMSAGDDRRLIIEKLFHRSKVNTIVTRYLTLYPRDGRLYPTIKAMGTVTERLAYSGPPLQQIPHRGRWARLRSMVEAAPGNILISADYSQLEARILAVLANDTPSLEAFAAGQDIHAVNALDLFTIHESEYLDLPAAQREGSRDYSKSFLYKISYGGRSELLKAKAFCPCELCADDMPPTLHLNRAQAKAAGDRWFAKHYAVKTFRAQLADTVKRFGYYESPLGGRRYVYGAWRDIERTVYNLPMQWIAAQITRRAMCRLYAAGTPLILNQHDALAVEVPERDVERYTDLLRESMTVPVAELGGTVFPVKVTTGHRWNEL